MVKKKKKDDALVFRIGLGSRSWYTQSKSTQLSTLTKSSYKYWTSFFQ
jgi:hypothetical protein